MGGALAGVGEMIQFSLVIGDFKLEGTSFDNRSIWISRESGEYEGEGLQISDEQFAAIIEQYFQENM